MVVTAVEHLRNSAVTCSAEDLPLAACWKVFNLNDIIQLFNLKPRNDGIVILVRAKRYNKPERYVQQSNIEILLFVGMESRLWCSILFPHDLLVLP